MLISFVMLVVLLCFCWIAIALCSEAFFERCDIDTNRELSRTEFENCFKDMSKHLGGLDLQSDVLFKHLDRDRDGKINIHEYASLMKINSETVSLTDRYGKKQEISTAELLSRAKSSNPNITMIDGKLATVDSGAKKISEIENHELSMFIEIGKYIANAVTLQGIKGNLSGLNSLPYGGTLNATEEVTELEIKHKTAYEMWIILTFTISTAGRNINEFYEAHVEVDKMKYRRPYCAILNVWRLDASRKTRLEQLSTPPPNLRSAFLLWIRSLVGDDVNLNSLLAMVVVIVIILSIVGLISLAITLTLSSTVTPRWNEKDDKKLD